jgi:PHD/YefM family antitoxin component YafN of YafNO toxin-antitoxin module
MKTITLKNALTDLPDIIASTLRNQEETIIVTENGSVVMLDNENWEGMKETINLIKDKTAFNALIQGHRQRDQKSVSGKSINDVFDGL